MAHVYSITSKIVTDFLSIFRDFIFGHLMSKSVSECGGLGTHLMIQVLQFLWEVAFLYPSSAPKTVFT